MAVILRMPVESEAKVHPFFTPRTNTPDLEIDPNESRRKRRKTASPKATQTLGAIEINAPTWVQQLSDAAGQAIVSLDANASSLGNFYTQMNNDAAVEEPLKEIEGGPGCEQSSSTSTTVAEPPGARSSPQLDPRKGTAPTNPSKKMLRVRSDGKLSSPGKSGVITEPGRKKRGRPRLVLNDGFDGIVIMKYGKRKKARMILGQKIDAILSTTPVVKEVASVSGDTHEAFTAPRKPTHPFFSGGHPRVQDASKSGATELITKTTTRPPGSPAKVASPLKARVNSKPPGIVQAVDDRIPFGLPTFGTDHARINRFPGAQEPPWPPEGMVHVRNITVPASETPFSKRGAWSAKEQRKSKDAQIKIGANEEVLRPFVEMVQEENQIRNDFRERHREFRRPRRRVMSGQDLQKDIRSRISHHLPVLPWESSGAMDEPSASQGSRPDAPPALTHIYQDIARCRSAFDKFECEPQTWTSKYAPKAAAHVLQQGREASLIRDWLKALTVTAVSAVNASSIAQKHLRPSKRKRKRAEELDGFVVPSDEEASEMAGLSGDDGSESNDPGAVKKTIVQFDGQSRIEPGQRASHTIVVSGPNGSGKSAAICAIAQELDFEIFEINSGSRRSGKDIMDRVGDMTRNHLVKSQPDSETKAAEDQAENFDLINDKLQQDIQSGRQGTMKSFFTSKARAKNKSSHKEPNRKPRAHQIPKPPKETKSQKQSLILLEEVDILFEEDKLFWSTVLDLMVTTRRPVIMTCTDEKLLPLDDMTLHGIFRFAPCPEPLAVDYLLLVACSEGHLLQRDAVSALYHSKAFDLRASLVELQFFCQLAIGDRKGGLEWMLLDQKPTIKGKPLQERPRIVSEGTYFKGLGWLGGEVQPKDASQSVEQHVDVMSLACSEYDLDFTEIGTRPSPCSFAEHGTTRVNVLQALRVFDESLHLYSLVDTMPKKALRRTNKAPLDATQPECLDKFRSHFVEGLSLLQADALEDETGFSLKLALTLQSLADRNADYNSESEQDADPAHSIIEAISQPGCHTSGNASFVQQSMTAAFHPIAHSSKPVLGIPKGPQISSFDGPTSTIAEDLAPYVRSIVTYDLRLEDQRQQLSAALAQPGTEGGKTRRTRASRAALEGGNKADTRRERWFPKATNFDLILRTGGDGWQEAALSTMDNDAVRLTPPDDVATTETSKAVSTEDTSADSMDDELR